MQDRTARIDVAAISQNVARLRHLTGADHFIAVVKADGYGHGASTAARAALAGGAEMVAVADIEEATMLRDEGIRAPVLCWLHGSGETFREAVHLDLDIGLSRLDQIHTIARAAGSLGRRARIHVKVDTGLSRNGFEPTQVAEAARRLTRVADLVETVGVFTHLSNTSPEADAASLQLFDAAIAEVRAAGLTPEYLHAAATAACLSPLGARYGTVRVGLGIYGVLPAAVRSIERPGLRPAMTLAARVVAVREAHPGVGVSYDHLWRADRRTRLALVPLGYADGVPRAALNNAEVLIHGDRYPIVGRVAMDQFVVDVGAGQVVVGDDVVLWGGSDPASPQIHEWADWSSSSPYELLVGVGRRVARIPA